MKDKAWWSTINPLGIGFLVAILVSATLASVYVSQLQKRISAVESNYGGALGWAATQVEVDLLLLVQLAREAQEKESDLAFLRRRHAAFHSRVLQTQNGFMWRELGDRTGYAEAVDELMSVTHIVKSLLEADDDKLKENLPEIASLLSETHLPPITSPSRRWKRTPS
ncbi:MAG: hypothetical protein AAF360_15940 [Pseudomonadota bacterium]